MAESFIIDMSQLKEGMISKDGESVLYREQDSWVWKHKETQVPHHKSGPAVIKYNGHMFWMIDGVRHRLDGPAAEYRPGLHDWYIHGNLFTSQEAFEAAKAPVSVTTPVVVDALTEEGVAPFVQFVRSLENHSNIEAALAEAKRLNPYFKNMSLYLTPAVEVLKKPDEEKKTLRALTSKGGISKLFTDIARCTRTTLISEVAVLPSNIIKEGPAAPFFKRQDNFNVDYKYNSHIFNFGFLQVYQEGMLGNQKNSTTFPIFMLDYEMIDDLDRTTATKLLAGFKEVMTFVNHDTLHHFTSLAVRDEVADDSLSTVRRSSSPVYKWFEKNVDNLYEEWAHIGHEKAVFQKENKGEINKISKAVDQYFDVLKQAKQNHDVTDYFGTMMIHALTRVFSLNDLIVQGAIKQLEKIDPTPEEIVADVAHLLKARSKDIDYIAEIARNELSYSGNESRADIITAYKAIGLDILPEELQKMDYSRFKMLQLVFLITNDVHNDLRPHLRFLDKKAAKSISSLSSGALEVARLRDKTDNHMLSMIEAVNKTIQMAQPLKEVPKDVKIGEPLKL